MIAKKKREGANYSLVLRSVRKGRYATVGRGGAGLRGQSGSLSARTRQRHAFLEFVMVGNTYGKNEGERWREEERGR